MKKYVIALLSLCLILSLFVSCGGSNNEQAPQQTDEESVEGQVPETHYTDNQTEIANITASQQAVINNGWIYSAGIQDNDYGFYKRRVDNSEVTRLHSDVDPTCITIQNEYIYAVLRDFDTNNREIYRYRLGGDDEKQLVDKASTLQIIGDAMYYCKYEDDPNETTKFCKANLNGENEEVIIDKKIYFPCVIDNTVFYQDDVDNETIHKFNIETKEDVRITQDKTYSYFLNDDYIYCIVNDNSTRDNDNKGTLVKIDLQSLESTTLYDGAATSGLNVKDNKIYFVNSNDEERIYSIEKDGSNIGIITQDTYTLNPIIEGDMLFYVNCDADYSIEEFVMCKLDGSNKVGL